MIYILFSLLYSVESSSIECSQLINRMDILSKIPGGAILLLGESMPYLILSGTGPKMWGQYDTCMREPNMTYADMIAYTNLGLITFGFCHSDICSANDFNDPVIQTQLKEIIHRIGLDAVLQLDLMSAQLSFFSPEEINHPEYDIGFYCTIIIMCILVILSLTLPAMQILFNFKTRKQRYQYMYGQIQEESANQSLLSNSDMKVKETSVVKFFKMFSIQENYHQLIKLDTPDPNLAIFNGFRALAFIMVVFGHQFFITAQATYLTEMLISFKSWIMLILLDMLYSVDIFFWIGGFFLGFVIVDQKKSQSLKKNPFVGSIFLILHRVLRIWPCYVITILITWNLAIYLGDGPRWFQAQPTFECTKWYRSLLFYGTFQDDTDCIPWGWYLSNDMQLFLVSLIPLMIYIKFSPMIGKLIIGALLIATQAYGIWLCYHEEYLLQMYNMTSATFMTKYYLKPWCRGPPYFIGLLFGIYYREFKNNKKNPEFKSVLMWLSKNSQSDMGKRLIQIIFYLIGFGLVGVIFVAWRPCQLDANAWSPNFQHFWQGVSRTVTVLGLSFMAIPNMVGIQDIFNSKIMNCGFFKITAKISFTGYLIHYVIETVTISDSYQTPNFNSTAIIYCFVGNFGITFASAVLMSLMVEMPFGKLEQKLLGMVGGNKKKIKQMEDELISNPLNKKIEQEGNE